MFSGVSLSGIKLNKTWSISTASHGTSNDTVKPSHSKTKDIVVKSGTLIKGPANKAKLHNQLKMINSNINSQKKLPTGTTITNITNNKEEIQTKTMMTSIDPLQQASNIRHSEKYLKLLEHCKKSGKKYVDLEF